jgi:hypothetical protein
MNDERNDEMNEKMNDDDLIIVIDVNFLKAFFIIDLGIVRVYFNLFIS